jgi:hypothetical protein
MDGVLDLFGKESKSKFVYEFNLGDCWGIEWDKFPIAQDFVLGALKVAFDFAPV